MFVDAQTYKDLEVLHGRDGGASVGTELDRTVTRLGHRQFRSRLASPGSSADSIRAHLESCRFLSESGVRFSIHPRLVGEVEEYLNSPIASLEDHGVAPGPWGMPHAVWTASRYPDLLVLARDGVRAIRTLVAHTDSLLRELESGDPPPGLNRLVRRLRDVLDSVQGDALPPTDRSLAILSADRTLRDRHREELLTLLQGIGELDVAFAGARLLEEGFCIPEVSDDPDGLVLEGVGLWHPFLSSPVPNPVTLGTDRNVLLLTGPNMAGKTTYLRAVAVCVHLAHCGLPVPARAFRFTPLDALFVTLSPEDHLRSGLSFFKAEVLRARDVLQRVVAGSRTLAIFDEVFQGTNVRDAREASDTLIRGCARARRSGFVFASHLSELGEDLADEDSISFSCFQGTVGSNEINFDYRLRMGVSDQRLGLHILRQEGLDQLLERIEDLAPVNKGTPPGSRPGESVAAAQAPQPEPAPAALDEPSHVAASRELESRPEPAPEPRGWPDPRRLAEGFQIEIRILLRAMGLWMLGRAMLAGLHSLMGQPPLAQSPLSSLGLIGLVGLLVWIDTRRRNEDLLLANLGVPRWRLCLLGVAPPAGLEVLLLVIQP